MADSQTVKMTYSLPAKLADRIRTVVAEGAAPSYSAFAERAFEAALRKEKERRLAEVLAAAAADPQFLEDIEDVERDFAVADAEIRRSENG